MPVLRSKPPFSVASRTPAIEMVAVLNSVWGINLIIYWTFSSLTPRKINGESIIDESFEAFAFRVAISLFMVVLGGYMALAGIHIWEMKLRWRKRLLLLNFASVVVYCGLSIAMLYWVSISNWRGGDIRILRPLAIETFVAFVVAAVTFIVLIPAAAHERFKYPDRISYAKPRPFAEPYPLTPDEKFQLRLTRIFATAAIVLAVRMFLLGITSFGLLQFMISDGHLIRTVISALFIPASLTVIGFAIGCFARSQTCRIGLARSIIAILALELVFLIATSWPDPTWIIALAYELHSCLACVFLAWYFRHTRIELLFNRRFIPIPVLGFELLEKSFPNPTPDFDSLYEDSQPPKAPAEPL